MQPQDDLQTRNVQVPQRDGHVLRSDREAAAQLMRQQINSIYDEGSGEVTGAETYHQTHSETNDHTASQQQAQGADWQQYHSAWQNYYQQYYERYYLAQLQQRKNQLDSTHNKPEPQRTESTLEQPQELTQDEAVNELRSKIIHEVKGRSEKIRRSRHFMPLVAGLTVALVFGLLQYNRLIIAQVKAYVSPGAIDPQNIVLDPTTSTKVGPEPKVIIPKINVDAPVVFDITSLEEHYIQSNLKNGVVHYPIPGADGFPGERGNTVLLGHSSNDVFDDGAYKFVFVQLDKLNKGDIFYIHHNSIRYTYSVTEKKIINPNQVSELVIGSNKPLATLVTCTPPGTALQRLVVIAEQISPDPDSARDKQKAAVPTSTQPTTISGNSPTLFERLFGF